MTLIKHPNFLTFAPPRLCERKINKISVVFSVLLCLFSLNGLFAQQDLPFDGWAEARGDTAIAERYLLWAEDAIAAGNWSQARAALERAADFANVSSDISYLLALARAHENESRGPVLQALKQAILTGRWKRYSEAHARLLEAEQLITLRRYYGALDSLAIGEGTIDFDMLRLAALKGLAAGGAEASLPPGNLPIPAELRRRILESMDRYPRDPRPIRLLFDFARRRKPTGDDIALVELALKRLPFLLEIDPDLAWMAAPFIGDVAEARRLVAAYRAGSYSSRPGTFRPNSASIVTALNLGLLDDMDAVEELFSPDAPNAEIVLDKELIVSVGDLLRGEEGRILMAQKLLSFTGAITQDNDRDGYPESRAVYRQGILREYHYDADQDGLDDVFILFDSGSPQLGEIAVLPAAGPSAAPLNQPTTHLLPANHCLIHWERYPSVQQAVFQGETFMPAPGDFHFAPVNFEELGAAAGYAGLLFPRYNPLTQGINRRMLAVLSLTVQRPASLGFGAEFEGGLESVYLRRGLPVRAEVSLNGRIVSITDFEDGIPVIQRLDLDLDGRMETIRRFRGFIPGSDDPLDFHSLVESSVSDWNGDGKYKTGELYMEDGSVVHIWDLDGSGKLEFFD